VRVAVVGSGPAGFAAAQALVRRGLIPTVLDVGETLPAERQMIVERMKAASPSDWTKEDRAAVSENPYLSIGKVPKKMVFGSEFYFGRDRTFSPTEAHDRHPVPTYALGGFSVAWGAALMPPHQSDLDAWPITSGELEPSYRRVLQTLPLSAAHDALETFFPLYRDDIRAIPIAPAAADLLHDLSRSVSVDEGAPFVCGRARLAVEAAACRACGLCLSGCVYGAIYSTGGDILRLDREGKIAYRPALVVEEVQERSSNVVVRMRRLTDGTAVEECFDRVFLAAGAIQSTRIVLNSLQLFDHAVRLRDSQKFIVPLLRVKRGRIDWPEGQSLASLFLDYKVPEISDRWIHVQVSTVNDYLLHALGIPAWRPTLRRRLMTPVLERLFIAWGGLHSDQSGKLDLVLRRPAAKALPVLAVRAVPDPNTRAVVKQAIRRLSRTLIRAGAVALSPATLIGPPGGGNHLGGSMPMRHSPKGALETDTLGRPNHWLRIHVVDGSVLPSVPATTFALVQMANADRIATAADFSG
jgi:ferredoxin